MKLRVPWTALVTALLLSAWNVVDAHAQSGEAWNEERVLELVAQARAERHSATVDSAMHSYRAQARGYVYFFMDRSDDDDRTLVKTDQVALDISWQAPNATRQKIVGLRDRESLPTGIRYHLDHLTVVQDDFGDFIRLGDGDEVARVLHPVGPEAEAAYDYLLADSLTLSYAGGSGEVRVYEVRVRPKNLEQPGFVGSIFLDRQSAAIVRMNFSFTPASYVDPSLDYIRISLDNSLWMGRHWLPYRQETEIRRELPVLDFIAGSVIRGRYTIRDYEFNADLPPAYFAGRQITSASIAEREAFPFERGIFDDLEQEGLSPSPSLEEVRADVDEAVQESVMSGLAPLRVHLASISDAARYNRAEGIFLGAGFTFSPPGDLVLRTAGGYAFGRRRASGALTATGEGRGALEPELHAFWDELRDVGGHPGATPLENTITSASGSKDYLDPYFARGAALTFEERREDGFAVTLRWERQVGARDVVSEPGESDFRPVRSIEEGSMGSLEVSAPWELPAEGRARLTGSFSRLGERDFVAFGGEAEWELSDPDRPWEALVTAHAGFVSDEAPPQSMYLLGGRNTLPGHDYRAFVGDRYWLVKAEATLPIRPPWVGLRLVSALGATYLGDRTLPADWAAADSGGLRASVGLGLSLGWDVLRLDLYRGLRGGGWEAVFSVAPEFRDWI